MIDFIRAHQLNIMLSLSSICGITAVFVMLTGKSSRKKRALLILEIAAMILLGAERLAYLYSGDASAAGYWKVRIYNYLDYAMVPATILAFNRYLREMFRERGLKDDLKRFKITNLLLIAEEILIVVSQFTGFYYTFDETNRYHRGSGIVICFLIPMIAILILISLVIQYYGRLSRRMRLSLLLFSVIPFASSFVQLFMYGVSVTDISIVSMAVLLYIFDLIDMNRTAALSDRAIAANEAKSEFLAQMSHEIRTPINAVLGMNEMILRESHHGRDLPPGDGQGMRAAFESISVYAGDVENAGKNLLAIINDILDLSKIEAGRMDIIQAPYHLNSLLNDVCSMFRFRAKEKGLAFTVEVEPSLPNELYGDEVRIRQIVTNLLSNAVKYTSRGSVTLMMGGEKQGDSLRLTVSVKDTGIGIRAEDLKSLFVKFQRLDLKQNSAMEGTGLGLAITHNLLDLMGGSVHVESEYGKGSVFTVTIPQRIVSPEPVGDFQRHFESSTEDGRVYREAFHAPDARVLIVDDTKMNLTVVCRLLKNTRLRIDTADSGEEAVALAQKNAYDVIFMDQRMPRMDGTEAMRHIREEENGLNKQTPVICLTADAVIGAKERYFAQGFSDYMTKPIDSGALENMLMKHLPEEKVFPVEKDSGGPAFAESDQDSFRPLREAGVDPAEGLRYCQNDGELYRSLLREYARNAEEKAKAIQEYRSALDWKNYSILVHSLKSTSRLIGAVALSEFASRMENAANKNDAETIGQSHEAMMRQYEATVQAIHSFAPEAEAPPVDDEVVEYFSDEDDALEFMPK